MRKLLHRIFNRIVVTALFLLLQIWVIVVEIVNLYTRYSKIMGIAMNILSVVIVIFILYKDSNPAFKLAWIVPILLFPIFGGFLYLIYGHLFRRPKLQKNMDRITPAVNDNMKQDAAVMESISQKDRDIYSMCRYISDYGPAPIWSNTDVRYFDDGKPYWESLLDDLKKAEKYIFLEYFIIGTGRMWDSILEVLKEKAEQGIDVRVIYDDFGSVLTLPTRYFQQLEKMGIQAVCFNRINPIFSLIFNNRDHRKIVVIDGNVGYTGGINLADEYVNLITRYGYWKDAGLRLEGPAVDNMTVMFMQMWNASGKKDEDIAKYLNPVKNNIPNDLGFVQPYGDSPLDDELVGENVYLNIINNAKDYLWIYTPYLIMDNVMMESLKLACKRGVDVRIVTPGIPDKKMVFHMTRCSYLPLMKCGAKIYEYEPGFIHSKCTLCDDEIVDIGTINYDYRSLYHHFECGVLMYRTAVTDQLKADMLETFGKCRQVTEEFLHERKMHISISVAGPVLHLFAPLL